MGLEVAQNISNHHHGIQGAFLMRSDGTRSKAQRYVYTFSNFHLFVSWTLLNNTLEAILSFLKCSLSRQSLPLALFHVLYFKSLADDIIIVTSISLVNKAMHWVLY